MKYATGKFGENVWDTLFYFTLLYCSAGLNLWLKCLYNSKSLYRLMWDTLFYFTLLYSSMRLNLWHESLYQSNWDTLLYFTLFYSHVSIFIACPQGHYGRDRRCSHIVRCGAIIAIDWVTERWSHCCWHMLWASRVLNVVACATSAGLNLWLNACVSSHCIEPKWDCLMYSQAILSSFFWSSFGSWREVCSMWSDHLKRVSWEALRCFTLWKH
jgi:hypothetical protein